MVQRRVAFLTGYQDAAYAERYRALVERVRKEEQAKGRGLTGLSEAVARYYFKLLAYKDEYEVARLYTDGAFEAKLKAQFEDGYKLKFNLAPPLFSKRDPVTGELQKTEYGPWIWYAFKLLAKLRGLRGSPFDIFGYTHERRTERQLIRDYELIIDEVLGALTPDNHALAVQIASIPEEIRGFGHVKERHLKAAKDKEASLLAALRTPRRDAVRGLGMLSVLQSFY